VCDSANDSALRASPLGSINALSAERELRPVSGDCEGFPVEGAALLQSALLMPGAVERFLSGSVTVTSLPTVSERAVSEFS